MLGSETKFFNPTKGVIPLANLPEEILAYMREDKAKRYEVIVGCDSSATEDPTFPVAVVVLRKGAGGRFFLNRVHYQTQKFPNRQQRILQEILLSIELASTLKTHLRDLMDRKGNGIAYEFEAIHADVGENGLTKDMVKEVTGLIRGNGFRPYIKPNSFAASSVADRFT